MKKNVIICCLILCSIIGLVGAFNVPSPTIPTLPGKTIESISSPVNVLPTIQSNQESASKPLETSIVSSDIETDNVQIDAVSEVNLIKNGDFERPKIPQCAEYIMFELGDRINEWIVEKGSVDPNKAWKAASGTQSVDILGDYSGKISQTVSTTPNKNYKLSFYYAGNPDDRSHLIKKFKVLWDDKAIATLSFDTTYTSRTNMGWQYYEITVKAKQKSSKVSFEDISPYNRWAGAAIDNVKLSLTK